MSKSSQAVPAALESEEEVMLEPQQEAVLRAGLCGLPTVQTKAEFNARVLAPLTSGRDFDPWLQQVRRRLVWMLLPTVCGFGVTLVGALWFTRALPPLPAPYPLENAARPAPPLPPLPTKWLPPWQSPRIASPAPPEAPSAFGSPGMMGFAAPPPNVEKAGQLGSGLPPGNAKSQHAPMQANQSQGRTK